MHWHLPNFPHMQSLEIITLYTFWANRLYCACHRAIVHSKCVLLENAAWTRQGEYAYKALTSTRCQCRECALPDTCHDDDVTQHAACHALGES